MTYGLYTTPAGERALRKLYPKVKEHILQELQSLKSNPYLGKQLEGEMRLLRTLHTKHAGTHYRVAYEVDEKDHTVIVRYAASRENFYKELRRLPLKRAA